MMNSAGTYVQFTLNDKWKVRFSWRHRANLIINWKLSAVIFRRCHIIRDGSDLGGNAEITYRCGRSTSHALLGRQSENRRVLVYNRIIAEVTQIVISPLRKAHGTTCEQTRG